MIRKISTHSRKPIGLARKPSQPSPMQRNRPPHGPPAGGGSRRLASAAVLAPTRCVWSLRVRPFGSPSPLRGAAACCAAPCGARAAGPGRFGGVRGGGGPRLALRLRLRPASAAGGRAPRVSVVVAAALFRRRSALSLRAPPGALWGSWGPLAARPLLPFCAAPVRCSPGSFSAAAPVARCASRCGGCRRRFSHPEGDYVSPF